ncbi:hypothetical protein BIY24_12475 [Halobacteriovorax marinus]|uniref:hypothetical protein n=1 Tax=Halobacteriovorax marinus TaxID=97084 RepID=UPI000BC34CF2|nr:hypothetical protein [Halobacteriovorax marinus]ATH08732.1 hypothetical protein BIY24_12475 [Halobacteriovorax marinus]
MNKIFFLITFIISSTALGQEVVHMGRSSKALLLGDAYTARADDEYTLFYNPAALGRNSGVEISPLNPQIGVTNALDEVDRFKDFPSSDAAAISDRLLGFPVFVQAGAYPGLKMASFGFNLFARTRTSLLLENTVHPLLDIDYRVDRGFVAGFAYNFGKSSKSKQGLRSSLGISLKHIQREGLAGQFDLFGTELLSKIQNDVEDIDDIRNALGWSKGKAWGVDLGFEQSLRTSFSELSWGASILDVGGTKFRKVSGDVDIPEQEMYINAGVNWKQNFGIIAYSLSADLHPINVYMPFSRKIHLGLEVDLPFVSLLGGFSEGYLSYGLELRLWPFKFIAGFYSNELGVEFKEFEAKRAVFQLNLFDIDIDI